MALGGGRPGVRKGTGGAPAVRGVADSTIHPSVKAPLFLFTIPLDIVLLPFAAIGGAFG